LVLGWCCLLGVPAVGVRPVVEVLRLKGQSVARSVLAAVAQDRGASRGWAASANSSTARFSFHFLSRVRVGQSGCFRD